MITLFASRVYNLVKKVPKGRVTTYKQIAAALNCKAYRAVGQALKVNPYAPEVPCHRVVKQDGSLGGFGGQTKGRKIIAKKNLLAKEGVVISRGKVKDFQKLLFKLG